MDADCRRRRRGRLREAALKTGNKSNSTMQNQQRLAVGVARTLSSKKLIHMTPPPAVP